jgi:hypothetical protein
MDERRGHSWRLVTVWKMSATSTHRQIRRGTSRCAIAAESIRRVFNWPPSSTKTTSLKKGGTMIEYDDEDPAIRRRFEAELKKAGMGSDMPKVSYA